MIYRTVPFDIVAGALWAGFTSYVLYQEDLTNFAQGSHLNFAFLMLAAISGVVATIMASGLMERRTLKTIEAKGSFEPTHTLELALVQVALLAFVVLSLIFWSTPLQLAILAAFFVFPIPAAALFTEAFSFQRWQTKNKKVLYSSVGFSEERIYTLPSIEYDAKAISRKQATF